MRSVRADRYVLPLREGGSVPALVEGDDLGLYVVKLRGAGQGPKALVAELIAGELARAAGLLVPEIVLVDLDAAIAESEPDPELAVPLEASAGRNLGLDYLPGSIAFDPIASPAPDATLASRVVLFDALVANVDRTPRNPNLLTWHARLWLIDHGASLYFHHGWSAADPLAGSADPFPEVRDHVLLPWASSLADAAEHLAVVFEPELFDRVVGEVPSDWIRADPAFPDEPSHRAAYGAWLRARAAALPRIWKEAEDARARAL
ncbi:MAG: aminotransferase class I and II [Myxococcales bacterium]|nr:aminotransferase class I and II [Myxococcales bacterium]